MRFFFREPKKRSIPREPVSLSSSSRLQIAVFLGLCCRLTTTLRACVISRRWQACVKFATKSRVSSKTYAASAESTLLRKTRLVSRTTFSERCQSTRFLNTISCESTRRVPLNSTILSRRTTTAYYLSPAHLQTQMSSSKTAHASH